MIRRAVIAIVVILLGLTDGITARQKPAEPAVLVNPAASREPGWVELKIRIDPVAEDRALSVEIDSWAFFRSSLITLNGANSVSTYWLRFENLPAGEYVVRVLLRRSDDTSTTVESTFRVV